MFLSVKEICFFCLIFVIITIALIGFNQPFVKFKSLHPIVSSYIVSFLITIVLLSVYKLANIQHQEKESFQFELSKSKKCQGYPYMHSSNPELLKECAQELSTEEGICNARCDGHNFNNFEYTTESNQYWENERCGQQKPNPINSCRSGVNFIQYSPTGSNSLEKNKENFTGLDEENSFENFQENFSGPTGTDLLKTEKPVCAFGPGFVQYECPDGIKFFDSGVTSDPSEANSNQYQGNSGPSGANSNQYQGNSGPSGANSNQYQGNSGPSGANSNQYQGNSGPSGANSTTISPFGVSQENILRQYYNRDFNRPLVPKNKFNEKGTTYAYLANSTYRSRSNPERSILY
jgi:hypothetical protein